MLQIFTLLFVKSFCWFWNEPLNKWPLAMTQVAWVFSGFQTHSGRCRAKQAIWLVVVQLEVVREPIGYMRCCTSFHFQIINLKWSQFSAVWTSNSEYFILLNRRYLKTKLGKLWYIRFSTNSNWGRLHENWFLVRNRANEGSAGKSRKKHFCSSERHGTWVFHNFLYI